jgi:hypothetical protein
MAPSTAGIDTTKKVSRKRANYSGTPVLYAGSDPTIVRRLPSGICDYAEPEKHREEVGVAYAPEFALLDEPHNLFWRLWTRIVRLSHSLSVRLGSE